MSRRRRWADGRAAKGQEARSSTCGPRRAWPSPRVNVLFTAELKGGDDVEEFHCPEIEWDWDDGGKSVHEADCAPFETGTSHRAALHRTSTIYRTAGIYNVKATVATQPAGPSPQATSR